MVCVPHTPTLQNGNGNVAWLLKITINEREFVVLFDPWSTGNGSDDTTIDFGSIHPHSFFFKAGFFANKQKLLGNPWKK